MGELASGRALPIAEALEQALQSHRAGRLAQAEALYREVLAREPDNADALHLLGLIAHQGGNGALAIELVERAIGLQPDNVLFLANLGEVCRAAGRPQAAESWYRRALALAPDYAEARSNLAVALKQLGRLEEAEGELREALRLKPGYAEAHNNLGNVLGALGRHAEAQQSYRCALELRPAYPEALNNLGVTLMGLGDAAKAAEAFRQALAVKPDYAEAHCNLAGALRGLGVLEAAQASAREAVRLNPALAQAHDELGNVLLALGSAREAEQSYRRAIALAPDSAETHSNLANALVALGRLAEAEASCREALRLRPQFAEALSNLGSLLKALDRDAEAEAAYRKALSIDARLYQAHNDLGVLLLKDDTRLEEAARCFEQALALNPGLAAAHNNLGLAMLGLGRGAAAEQCHRRALAVQPSYPEALHNLGNALAALGRWSEAKESYLQALVLRPEYLDAHNRLTGALMCLGELQEAEQACRRALTLDPDSAEAHNNLGCLLQGLGRRADAAEAFRAALRIDPDYAEAQSNAVHQYQHLCAWNEVAPIAEALRARVAGDLPGRIAPFTFLALPQTTATEQLACARRFAAKSYAHHFSKPALCARRSRSERTQIRVGYLSADFFEHATSYLLAETIELHDRGGFAIYGYSYGPDDHSPMRARLERGFDHFRDVRRLPDESVAEQIVNDEIDLLVDLKGYTTDNRVEILAHRPAPVQVSWLGYPGTLGHPRLADYLIGDPVVTPLGDASHYSERLALMPRCYQPNDRKRLVDAPPTRANAGLPEQDFVFCCFNQSYKITAAVFDAWCGILRSVPRSSLWLLSADPTAQHNLLREAAARGIAPGRLVFAAKLPLAQHLARLQLADLALDTFPYTSHTTASDALWVGVPLLTRIGESFVSRAAASILSAAGMPDMIVRTTDAYCRLAVELATQPERLRAIRARLNANRAVCALFDSERFTRDLERLFLRMWGDHQRGVLEAIPAAD